MGFGFATCDRQRALGFLRRLYPSTTVNDTPEDAGPVLDFVAKDIIRIADPDFHAGSVVAGTHWGDADQSAALAALKTFHSAVLARST